MKTELQMLDSFEEDSRWLRENLETDIFRAKYENHFVAVLNKEVVASSENIEKLMAILKSRNIGTKEVLIEYIYPKDIVVLF